MHCYLVFYHVILLQSKFAALVLVVVVVVVVVVAVAIVALAAVAVLLVMVQLLLPPNSYNWVGKHLKYTKI